MKKRFGKSNSNPVLLSALVISALLFLLVGAYVTLTDYKPTDVFAIQLIFFVMLGFLITGILFIFLYFLGNKRKDRRFSDTIYLKAGLGLILLILAIRFEIFEKLLSYIF